MSASWAIALQLAFGEHSVHAAASGSAPQQPAPGFQFLGYGYDVVKGNPFATDGSGDPGCTTSIFVFTELEKQTTADGKWLVPDKTTAQSLYTCAEDQSVTTINSIYDYKNALDTGVDVSGSIMAVDFDLSSDTQHVRQKTANQSTIFYQVSAQCAAYRLTMHQYDRPELTTDFIKAVGTLPIEYNEAPYYEFLRSFGTHYIYAVTVGGRWGWQSEMQTSDYSDFLKNEVNVGAYVGYAGKFKAGLKITTNYSDSTFDEVMSSLSNNRWFNVGGTFNKNVSTWMDSVRDFPMPIHQKMSPLTELFTEDYLNISNLWKRKTNLQTAMNSYCEKLNAEDPQEGACTKPYPVPLPTPPPMPSDAVKVSKICMHNRLDAAGKNLHIKVWLAPWNNTSLKWTEVFDMSKWTSHCFTPHDIKGQAPGYLEFKFAVQIANENPTGFWPPYDWPVFYFDTKYVFDSSMPEVDYQCQGNDGQQRNSWNFHRLCKLESLRSGFMDQDDRDFARKRTTPLSAGATRFFV